MATVAVDVRATARQVSTRLGAPEGAPRPAWLAGRGACERC
jgi:hypothetical protein